MAKRKLAICLAKKDRFSSMTKWYEKGVHFKCHSCGSCCSVSGYVWLSDKDIQTLADFLNISKDHFIKKYTRLCMGRVSLKEYTHTGHCIFLKDQKCVVYKARPVQCKTFPFWTHIMREKENFLSQKSTCRGIEDSSCFFTKEEIEKKLLEYLENFSEKKS